MPCGATQDRCVMMERSDRMWSTWEGNGKPLQYSCLENPINSMKRQNDRILKDELPRSVGAQYATGDQKRNNSRKNEEMDLASITSYIHSWVLFLLWLHLFIISGVISPLIYSSILGTYRPGEFIFQCPIFLPFHTVHGVPKARILKWFAIPFSCGPRFVRTLHDDPSVLGILTRHGS